MHMYKVCIRGSLRSKGMYTVKYARTYSLNNFLLFQYPLLPMHCKKIK